MEFPAWAVFPALVLLMVATVFVISRFRSPVRENAFGLIDALWTADILWSIVFIALLPLFGLAISPVLGLFLFALLGTGALGFLLLWSGHRYARPAEWIGRVRSSWTYDPALELWEGERSRVSRRRLGLILLGLSPVVALGVALMAAVSA